MSISIKPWKGGGFMVDFYYRPPDGELRRKRVVKKLSRSAVDRWAIEHFQFLESGRKVQEEAPTLATFWSRYESSYAVTLEKTTRVSKKKTWRWHIERVLGRKRLDEIGSEAIGGLAADMKRRGLSPKYTNNVLADLSSILSKAEEWGVIEKRPEITYLKNQKPEIEFYEAEDLARLLAAARRIDADNELVVLLGADAGLRASEMIALSWGDIDLTRAVVRIEKSEPIRGEVKGTKSKRIRRIPLTARLRTALEAYRHLRGARVFYRDDGRTIDKHWLRDKVEAAQKLAGLLKTTGGQHVLRHTFGTALVARGVPLPTVQELMGHERIETTMRYVHLVKSATRDAIHALEGVESWATNGQRENVGARSLSKSSP